MIKRIIKISAAILLIPVVISTTYALYGALADIRYFSKNQAYFLAGVVAYVVIQALFYKPITLYVFGHELQHALATWFCGGKVKGFSVSKRGGSVSVTKSNAFISLAPYLVPIYTVFVLIVYVVLSWFRDMSGYVGYFIFFVGATLAFHVILTLEFLRRGQSDVVKTGYIFSLVVIYIVNIIVATFILSLVFKDISMAQFIASSSESARSIYLAVFDQLFSR